MIDMASQAEIDAAKAYESLFVPALFTQWVAFMAEAAKVSSGDRVLDVACGTGALTREVSARAGNAGSVTGLDPSLGMLEVARSLSPDIRWQQGMAESLPFADNSFDAVVSQFGLMFFRDGREAVREMLRVLVPGGRLAIAVWGPLNDMPAYASEVALLERTAGAAAADALKAPFVLGDLKGLHELFDGASVASLSVTTKAGRARFPSVRTMVEADLRGWLPMMDIVLPEDQISYILDEADRVLDEYVGADGAAEFDLSAHVVTGMKS